MGSVGGRRAREVVLAALQSETAPEVVASLFTALGTLRGEDSFAKLRAEARQGSRDVYLSGLALENLGKTRSAEDLDLLMAHLKPVGDWADWRWQRALLGLGWSRQLSAVDVLVDHLSEEYPQKVRATAALALGRLAKHHDSVKERAREALCLDLESKGMRVQLGHIGGLVALGDVGAVPALQRLRPEASDGRVMRVAYEACVRLRNAPDGHKAVTAEVEALREKLEALTTRLDRLEHPKVQ